MARPAIGRNRTVKVPDELWAAAQTVAEARGESVSDAVRRALTRYVKTAKPKQG